MWLSDLLLVLGGWGFEGEAGVSPWKWEAGELVSQTKGPESRSCDRSFLWRQINEPVPD